MKALENITFSNYLTFEVLKNGNLKLTLTVNGKEELTDWLKDGYNIGIWSNLLEQTSCNGSYAYTDANEVGGLTDSPMIISERDIDDEGEIVFTKNTKIWWYPNYMVIDELTELLNEEELIFTLS